MTCVAGCVRATAVLATLCAAVAAAAYNSRNCWHHPLTLYPPPLHHSTPRHHFTPCPSTTPRLSTPPQLLQCGVDDHVEAGMSAKYTVEPVAAYNAANIKANTQVTIYLAAEEVTHDYAPYKVCCGW